MSEHYFSDSAPAGADELRLLEIAARGHDLQMWVSDRVFSTSRLDLGTAQLLKTVPELPQSGRILDLGCGWGPVAVSSGLESPGAEVWAVDVNPRAMALTARNAEINGATNVWVSPAPEALQKAQAEGLFFDVILSNPPVRIGKPELHKMLAAWLSLLSPSGVAWLVMSKNLGGDSLIAWLNAQGYVASKFSSKKGFRIIHVARQDS